MQNPDPTFNEEDLRNQILQSLKHRADVDDLTFDLCKKTGWDWKKSTSFIQSIQISHRSEIELLWTKIFSILGIASMAAGVIIIFYFFDMYVGWNNIFSCIQQSANAAAVAGSNATTIKDCLVITFFGFLESISNNYGYIALALIIGGLTGFFIAQRQLRSTLGTGQPES